MDTAVLWTQAVMTVGLAANPGETTTLLSGAGLGIIAGWCVRA